jgi:hypothetical protein
MNISNLTFETLIVYIMPAAIVELLLLPLIGPLIGNSMKWYTDSTLYSVLGFLGLSIVLGLFIDMFSVAVSSNFQRKKRDTIFFGNQEKDNQEKDNLLSYRLEKLYPESKSKDEKVKLIYAIFNIHVQEHIYARRNYDWYFYQASRNTIASFFLYFIALACLACWLAIGNNLTIYLIICISVIAIIVLLPILYSFMISQLNIYYGYYVSVTLGYLLEQENRNT